MTRLYIAGPMSNRPLFNFPSFFQCAMTLRRMDHEVVNPAEIDMANGFDPGRGYEEQGYDLPASLRDDFRLILDCGGIVMLPDWEESRFAPLERAIAQAAGLSVYDYNPDARMGHVLTQANGMGRIQVSFLRLGEATA